MRLLLLLILLAGWSGGALAQRPAPADCAIPDPTAPARLVIVGAYESSRYASVTVGGQGGPTTYAKITVRSSLPVYLMISSFESMIWEIEGPVDTVVASSRGGNGGKGIGIVGVPADRIRFVDPNCPDMPPYDAYGDSPRFALLAKRLEPRLAEPGYAIGGAYTTDMVTIDDTGVASTQIERNTPFGSKPDPVVLDAARVVTNATAEPYFAYPGDMGLATLSRENRIRHSDAGDFAPWMKGYLGRPDVDMAALQAVRPERHLHIDKAYWTVLRETHLPAPNPWFFKTMWLVPAGVPEPVNATGVDLCVFLMDGFQYRGPEGCPAQLLQK